MDRFAFTGPNLAAFQRATGFNVQMRSLDWLPLRRDIDTLIRSNLAEVPWVPPSAISTLLALPAQQADANGMPYVLVPIPVRATTLLGARNPEMPDWLDAPDEIRWWNDFAAMVKKGEVAFNARQWEQGQAAMRAAQRNAAFWRMAHEIALVVSAPARWGAAAIEQGAQTVIGSTAFKLAAVGLGLVLLIKSGMLTGGPRRNPPRRRRRR